LKERVLIVEDERAIQLALGSLLRKEGYTVEVVSTGDAALACLGEHSFDLVISDLALGAGPNGMAVLQAARASRPETPVVLITAHGSEKVAVEAMKAGRKTTSPSPSTTTRFGWWCAARSTGRNCNANTDCSWSASNASWVKVRSSARARRCSGCST
jgi:DNA-binding NtrC family response regulator